MTELIDLHANDGGGGLAGDGDGDGDDFTEADLALDTPQGMVEEIDAGEFEIPGEEGDGGEWFDDLPDELREKVVAKGYKSVEELARAYVGAESAIGSRASEIAELRDAVANLASQSERRGYEPEPRNDQPPVPTMGQLAEYAQQIGSAIDEGQLDVGVGLARVLEAQAGVYEAREEDLMRRIEEKMGERTAPLEQATFRTEVGREINALKGQIGHETYAQYAPEVKALLADWERQQPGFVQNARAIRAAYGEVMLRQQATTRRETGSRVLDRTGRGGRKAGPTPAQQIVAEMDALDPGGLGGGL